MNITGKSQSMNSEEMSGTSEPILSMPNLWVNRPEAWFALLESNFRRHRITCEWKKFCHTLMCLDMKTLKSLRRIMDYRPHSLAYNILKRELINKYKKGKGKGRSNGDPRQRHQPPREDEQKAMTGEFDVDMNDKEEASETVSETQTQTSTDPESLPRRESLDESTAGTSAESHTKTPMETDVSNNTKSIDDFESRAWAKREVKKSLREASRAIKNIFAEASTGSRAKRRAQTLRDSAAGTSTESTIETLRNRPAGSSAESPAENPTQPGQSSSDARQPRRARIDRRALREMNYYIDRMVEQTKRNARRAMENGTWGTKMLRWLNVMKTLSHPDYDSTLLKSILALYEDDILIRVTQARSVRTTAQFVTTPAGVRPKRQSTAYMPHEVEEETE